MATLHIEHPITDLDTWLEAFARFEHAPTKAGVRSYTVDQPIETLGPGSAERLVRES